MKFKSEIRKDYFLNKYVIIAPIRVKRPKEVKEESALSKPGLCYFCPENIDKKSVIDIIKKNGKNLVTSISNIFPAVSLNNYKAYGTQEVIIDTPEHTKEFASLSEMQIELVLKMFAKRTEEISKDKKIDYILCFKNHGSKAGASIIHPHSQIFASAILPPEIQEELEYAKKYKRDNKNCPYCDIIKKEMKSKRKIFEDKNISAFTPYASQYHYEAWIFTKRHLDNITKLNKNEFKSFAKILKKLLVKLQKYNIAYNFFLHQIISDNSQHFYLKIQPRESIWAGVELGSGLVINSIPPEIAAKFYSK